MPEGTHSLSPRTLWGAVRNERLGDPHQEMSVGMIAAAGKQ